MDHRCLYGHRVPAAFTFAIQSRSCPTCGAPTVTVTGYEAARKLTTEVGLEAVAAFSAIRVLEADYVLTPVTAEPAAAPSPGSSPGAALAAAAVAPEPATEEDVVVVDDVVEAAPVAPKAVEAAPAPSVKADEPPVRPAPRPVSRPEPRVTAPAIEPVRSSPSPRVDVPTAGGFENAEEDFFKST